MVTPMERTTASVDSTPWLTETIEGTGTEVQYFLAPTRDGLYTPYALRLPDTDGPHPFVFVAYGNGGGGIDWLRGRMRTHGYILDRLLRAGYACGWGRYRTEVELGYHRGGPLVVDQRQGMELLNRSPLEFEDEIAILEHVRKHPLIDPDRIGHVGVSHAGEMLYKISSSYPGTVTAGVACEPANHEFLALEPDDSAFVNPETKLRNIEEMQMRDPAFVRSRIDEEVAAARIAPIETPMLVMGRDDDHLQGIFRLSYDLLAEAGKPARWVSWDHPLHGYIFPVADDNGTPQVDEVQDRAIDGIIEFLDEHLKS